VQTRGVASSGVSATTPLLLDRPVTARAQLSAAVWLGEQLEQMAYEAVCGGLRARIGRPRLSSIEAVSFFEPPPLPPEPPPAERWEPLAWEGPPEDVLGGVVALELLLARSQMAAVAIGSATAYRTGLEFTVELRLREDRQDRVWMGPPWEHRRSRSGELPDDLFRVGVQFEDGSKATTLDTGLSGTFVGPRGGVVDYSSGGTIGAVEGEEPEEPEVPDSPVLVARGGGGECATGLSLFGCGRCRPRGA
jgi:hypothetical protein